MKYAFKSKVRLTAVGGVNFNSVSQETIEDIVRYRFRFIRMAIDGASQATYEKYRVNGDFKRVIRNIMALNRYKREIGTSYPRLSWQFIIFGHNEHEILAARQLAEKLGMSFFTKRSWDDNKWSPIKNEEKIKEITGEDFVTRKDYVEKYGKDYMDDVCKQLWEEPVINWNGDLYGCCRNTKMSFGNVFESGLEAALNGERYSYMKDMITGKKPPDKSIVCTECPVFINRKSKAYNGVDV